MTKKSGSPRKSQRKGAPKLFLAWSGDKSQAVARRLHELVGMLFDGVQPFMSNLDIGAGAKWVDELHQALDASALGLLIVTSENLTNPWIHFEAGFLEGTQTTVIPLLVDLNAASIHGPLERLQARNITREHVLEVVRLIHRAVKAPSRESNTIPERLRKRFELSWPDVERDLSAHMVLSVPPQAAAVLTLKSRIEMYSTAARLLRRATTRVFDTTWGRPPRQRSRPAESQAATDLLASARGEYLSARNELRAGVKYFSLIGDSPRYAGRIESARERAAATSDYEVVTIGGELSEFPLPDFIVVDDKYVLISDYHRWGADDNPVFVESTDLARLLIGWFDESIRLFGKKPASCLTDSGSLGTNLPKPPV